MKKIYSILSLLGLIILLSACDAPETQQSPQQQLQQKRQALRQLQEEVQALEKQQPKPKTQQVGVAVELQTVVTQPFKHYFSVQANCEPQHYAHISPETAGQIKHIYVKEGDKVHKGQLLAALNTAVIESAIKEVATALRLATTVYEKKKELWDKHIGSEIELLRAKNDKERLEDKRQSLLDQKALSLIKAPIAGVIDDVAVHVGDLAAPGQRMMYLVNLSSFEIKAEIPENYLPFVHKHDKVVLTLLSYPDKALEARIANVAAYINPQNRSFEVSCVLPNKQAMLRPNMMAEMRLVDTDVADAVVVPSILVKTDAKGAYLFVAKGEGQQMTAEKQYLSTGDTEGAYTLIKAGLAPGQRIITKGYNQLTQGAAIQVL